MKKKLLVPMLGLTLGLGLSGIVAPAAFAADGDTADSSSTSQPADSQPAAGGSGAADSESTDNGASAEGSGADTGAPANNENASESETAPNGGSEEKPDSAAGQPAAGDDTQPSNEEEKPVPAEEEKVAGPEDVTPENNEALKKAIEDAHAVIYKLNCVDSEKECKARFAMPYSVKQAEKISYIFYGLGVGDYVFNNVEHVKGVASPWEEDIRFSITEDKPFYVYTYTVNPYAAYGLHTEDITLTDEKTGKVAYQKDGVPSEIVYNKAWHDANDVKPGDGKAKNASMKKSKDGLAATGSAAQNAGVGAGVLLLAGGALAIAGRRRMKKQ